MVKRIQDVFSLRPRLTTREKEDNRVSVAMDGRYN